MRTDDKLQWQYLSFIILQDHISYCSCLFLQCKNKDVTVSADDIPNSDECERYNMSWVNSEVHFDHVGMAYLALFQVATWKGWIQIMNDAIDSRDVRMNMERIA